MNSYLHVARAQNALDQSESADMEMTNQPSLSLTNNLELVPSMSPGRGEDTNNGIIQLVDNETSMAMVRRMLAVDHTSLMVHLPSGQLMPFNLPTQPAAGSWEATPVSQQVVPIPTAASVLPRDPCSRNTSPSASTLTKLVSAEVSCSEIALLLASGVVETI